MVREQIMEENKAMEQDMLESAKKVFGKKGQPSPEEVCFDYSLSVAVEFSIVNMLCALLDNTDVIFSFQFHEIVNMLLECCMQERSYVKMFGLLAERFCLKVSDLTWQ